MRTMIQSVLVSVLLVGFTVATQAADCTKWKKERFWKTATGADVAACLDAGADPNARKTTPLHKAAMYNANPEVAKVLIDAGADLERSASKFWMYSKKPLHLAAEYDNAAVVKVLINAGANLEARDRYGFTPLYAAAMFNKNPEIIKALVDAGANPNARNKWENTPLHRAAMSNQNPEVIQALVDAGANPNARNKKGERPMDLTKKKKARRILAAAGGTRTKKSGGSGGLGALIGVAAAVGIGTASGASTEAILAGVEAVASSQQTATGGGQPTAVQNPVETAGSAAGGGSCEIPGYPTPPGGLAGVGLAWCPASVNFQVRVFALQAAGIQCSVAAVPDPPPEVVSRARSQIREVCSRLAALGTRLDGPNSGASCRCPAGFGP